MAEVSTNGVEPELGEMLSEIKEIADPYTLGLHLGIEEHHLDIFEKEHPSNVERQKSKVLGHWKRNCEECSWGVLATAVEETGKHGNLAKKLREKHIQAVKEPVNVHLETTNKAIKQVDTQSKAVKANMEAADTEIDIIVKLPVRELRTPVRTISGLNKPWGVAINKRGEILVTETSGNQVSIFSPTGQKIRSFGSQGICQGQFNGPFGIAVDDDQNILVVDNGNHRIQKLSSDGRFITAVGTKGRGPLQFSSPIGIKINPRSKRIYVADHTNHRIQVLQPDLAYHTSFGRYGNGPGQFDRPWDIAFDSANNVYVTEYYNHRVQVFTENGEYLRQIGKKGTGKGEFDYAAMITTDDEDKIFVSSNHFVSVFTSLGEHLTSFGTPDPGNGPPQFNQPRGMAVDKAGRLYVCDYDNHRVQIF